MVASVALVRMGGRRVFVNVPSGISVHMNVNVGPRSGTPQQGRAREHRHRSLHPASLRQPGETGQMSSRVSYHHSRNVLFVEIRDKVYLVASGF